MPDLFCAKVNNVSTGGIPSGRKRIVVSNKRFEFKTGWVFQSSSVPIKHDVPICSTFAKKFELVKLADFFVLWKFIVHGFQRGRF